MPEVLTLALVVLEVIDRIDEINKARAVGKDIEIPLAFLKIYLEDIKKRISK
jgi:hypothetical protein